MLIYFLYFGAKSAEMIIYPLYLYFLVLYLELRIFFSAHCLNVSHTASIFFAITRKQRMMLFFFCMIYLKCIISIVCYQSLIVEAYENYLIYQMREAQKVFRHFFLSFLSLKLSLELWLPWIILYWSGNYLLVLFEFKISVELF